MRVTAAVLDRPGEPLALRDVELGPPRPDEVLVRLSAVGICATDLEFATFFEAPAVLGHEGAGIVERVGDRVTSVAPGDHVALSFTSCGRCRPCLTGSPGYCLRFDALNFSGRRPDGTSAVSLGGTEINAHFLGQSAFADHVVAPERAVVPIGKDADLTLAGPFGCGFQTGAGGVLNVLRPSPGSSIAIFGAGSVGIASVLAAALSGCTTVAVVDLNAERLATAESLGATHGVTGGEGAAEELRSIAPDGFDFVLETTGRADVLRTGVEALAPLGRCGVIGVGPSAEMSFDWRSVLNGRTITGIIGGGAIPQVFVPELLRLHAAGRFPVHEIVERFPFERIGDAVDAAKSGTVGKAVLTF
ncbi:NAD(P)-dependent alcohol dehydrogenase [Actinomadura livida]|uniref:Aryl-alcohol dehydrogenase n=1 Tax=Actinomadura livida TaxID=79909 RepID=A0A7W7N233_9ACTN|nr:MULTISPECIES: NAD(P)-dependent alcohol dehydrogenase [Actinomadura]MBB4778759.1 aryl-alcohol dehydrogenase [Actinomadura catellatispora]GGU36412.1 alcohol dehydrogenase [Actinomadura livida]